MIRELILELFPVIGEMEGGGQWHPCHPLVMVQPQAVQICRSVSYFNYIRTVLQFGNFLVQMF